MQFKRPPNVSPESSHGSGVGAVVDGCSVGTREGISVGFAVGMTD